MGIYRGRALGCATLSAFPLQPYPQHDSNDFASICRSSDALVQLGMGTVLYTGVIYGPTSTNQYYHDPERVFRHASQPIIERACMFRGPAIISGDFNRELRHCAFWPLLQQRGWCDMAELAEQLYGWCPEPTCKDKTRKSFILANATLAQTLLSCHTVEKHVFDAHPVLQAEFDIETFQTAKITWSLPRSSDDVLIDPQLLEQSCEMECGKQQRAFQEAIVNKQADTALLKMIQVYEKGCQHSTVTTEGLSAKFPAGSLKKVSAKLTKKRLAMHPIVKQARHGEPNFNVCQASVWLRQRVAQTRRIKSLIGQLHSSQNSGNAHAQNQCIHLWSSIVNAPSFPKGFQAWCLQHLKIFIPIELPTCEYLQLLNEELIQHVQLDTQREKAQQFAALRKKIQDDILCGGSNAYKQVRDTGAPPLTFITTTSKCEIKPLRWAKEGRRTLYAMETPSLRSGMPVTLQGQTSYIERIEGNCIILTEPVKLRAGMPAVIEQLQHTSNNDDMQMLVGNAWSHFWNLTENDDDDLLQRIQNQVFDWEPCEYLEFDEQLWQRTIQKANPKSSRGACGLSVVDIRRFPAILVQWLFQIFRLAEQHGIWPSRLTAARVVMLAKPDAENNDPLGVRPITILSVLYRLWSTYRSQQILRFLGQHLQPQIGGIANRISSDSMATLVCDYIEQQFAEGESACGLVVDLVKCFNLIPRRCIHKMMTAIGIPEPIVKAHGALLEHLHRFIEIAGQTGSAIPSCRGVPEGCAFSVVTMTVLTVFAALELSREEEQLLLTMFADNWGLVTDEFEVLQRAAGRLQLFVDKLGMQISPTRSWTWATTTAIRKMLPNIFLKGERVQSKISAKDLGCDVSYSKRSTKKVNH